MAIRWKVRALRERPLMRWDCMNGAPGVGYGGVNEFGRGSVSLVRKRMKIAMTCGSGNGAKEHRR